MKGFVVLLSILVMGTCFAGIDSVPVYGKSTVETKAVVPAETDDGYALNPDEEVSHEIFEGPVVTNVKPERAGTDGRGWQTIKSETVEGLFPNDWSVYADSGSADCYWDDVSCNSSGGSWSAWCADEGGSAPGTPCAEYIDDMRAWMVYGPFDLSDATDAEMLFDYSNDSETDYDYFRYMASSDGTNYSGYQHTGSTGGWVNRNFDLASYCGDSSVWIGFQFTSDGSVHGYEGAYVDDITIQKNIPDTLADLTPYEPGHWNYEIPIGVTQLGGTETHSYTGMYYSDQTLYYNWASINNGASDATGYTVRVEVTGTGGHTLEWTNMSTSPGHYTYLSNDQSVGPLSAGNHTFKVWVDYNDNVTESNESNNYYERTINVIGVDPDIRIDPTTLNFNQSKSGDNPDKLRCVRDGERIDITINSETNDTESTLNGVFQTQIDNFALKSKTGISFIQAKKDGYSYWARETGDPLLPNYLVYVILSENSDHLDTQFQIEAQEELSGTFELPVKQPEVPTLSTSAPGRPTSLRPALQNSTESFPCAPVEFVHAGTIRGYRIGVYRVWPFQYVPATGKLILNSKITWSSRFETDPTQRLFYKVISDPFRQLVNGMVVNRDDIQRLYPRSDFNSPRVDFDYLIITSPGSLSTAFQALADYKISRGVSATVIDTSTIYATYAGADNQAKIKACIQDYALNSATIWVLLGGDDTIVPDRNCYGWVLTSDGPAEETTIPTDLYYAGLDQMDWNQDGDAHACEPNTDGDTVDLYPDVFIGRAPVRTSSEADAFIDKVIDYVDTPPTSNFVEQMLLSGVHLWNTWDGRSDADWRTEQFWMDYIDPHWDGTRDRFYDTNTDFGGSGYDVTADHLRDRINTGYNLFYIGPPWGADRMGR